MIKIKDRTKPTICVYCGETATRLNKWNQPVCKDHIINGEKERPCPECGAPMKIRQGKFGYFWGCTGFPHCDKTLSLQQELNLSKTEKD